jgi:uncharacterized integral membrane protein
MPWRLIGFILIFGLFLGFIGLNLGNTCDISFGFTVIRGVPVYLTAFSSFILGLLLAFLLILPRIFKRKARIKDKTGESGERKNRKKKGKSHGTPPQSIEGDDGPYGID